MPDTFQNARAYFDVTFPTSGDGFSISGMRNALSGIASMDMIPGQPRAHNPANMSIMVRGRDASSYYNPFYYGDADQRIAFSSGDTPTMSAPVSNPRIDIVYMTPSGDLRVATGTEAASPTLPSLAPSGDTRLPIAAIWHKVSETKIVNFEDKDSNSGDGYIYQDLRPWIRTKAIGSTVALTTAAALSATGDNAVGTATTAARADHTHQGVHTIKVVGSGDMFGDVELAGKGVFLNQQGRRITFEAAEIVVGTYTGNGVDNRWLTIGFRDASKTPRLVATSSTGAESKRYRTSTMVGDDSAYWGSAANDADAIQAFDTNRFQLGTGNGNTNAATYHYFAIG